MNVYYLKNCCHNFIILIKKNRTLSVRFTNKLNSNCDDFVRSSIHATNNYLHVSDNKRDHLQAFNPIQLSTERHGAPFTRPPCTFLYSVGASRKFWFITCNWIKWSLLVSFCNSSLACCFRREITVFDKYFIQLR